MRFPPIFDSFLVPKWPTFKEFWDFPWPKTRHHGLKRGSKHLFEHPKWSRKNVEKIISFAPGTLVDPPLAPAVRGLGCPPAVRSDNWSGCLGVSLSDSKGGKPPKVVGCGCPQNRILSQVAEDTVRAWFWGVGVHCADFGAFWRLFGPFLGHFVELKGTRGLFDVVKSSRTFPFVWAFCPESVLLWAKSHCFWPKSAQIWEGTPRLGATGEVLA